MNLEKSNDKICNNVCSTLPNPAYVFMKVEHAMEWQVS